MNDKKSFVVSLLLEFNVELKEYFWTLFNVFSSFIEFSLENDKFELEILSEL